MLVVTSDPAAKGLVKDLEVTGAGQVDYHFSLVLYPTLSAGRHFIRRLPGSGKDCNENRCTGPRLTRTN